MKILYIHGYGSDGNSTTAQHIRNVITDVEVISPTFIDYSSVHNIKINIKKISNIIVKHNIDIIVASSMGAFIASKFSGFPMVLINPCLKPSIELPKLITNMSDKQILEFMRFEKTVIDEESRLYTHGIFSDNDELFSYRDEFIKKYGNRNVWNINDGHRISLRNVKTTLVEAINELYDDMCKFNSLNESEIVCLNESYINAFEPKDMSKYIDEVWSILEYSYKEIGGTSLIAADKRELMETSDMWKMVRRNGKIVAVQIYTFKRGGRKAIACGTNGSIEGKQGLYDIIKEDIKLYDRNAWVEVSGKMEFINIKFGAHPIPAKIAQEILHDKIFTSIDEDGFHYTRLIGGKPIRKIMFGNFKK